MALGSIILHRVLGTRRALNRTVVAVPFLGGEHGLAAVATGREVSFCHFIILEGALIFF